ncbi:uncharacterized protein CG1161-like [Epargyreus clarus]|uniref:uncharacterized protein CG1161-like n=1 Tax=Epargyreus clarus TaxID=520877 RepID=UPI003C2BAC20
MIWKLAVLVSIFCINVEAQYYEDKRCRCLCPNPATVLNNTEISDRRVYIAYVPPIQCNCDGVVLPRVADQIKEQAQVFCPHCECKYETRNSTIIKVVVIIVLWLITLLYGYMFFLVTLGPLITKTRRKVYEEPDTEESISLLMQGEGDFEE